MNKSKLMSRFYVRLLVPTILINMVSSVGALCDTIIVGNILGGEALVSITFNSPLFMLINTVGALFAMGSMNEVGRLVGNGDAKASARYFTLAINCLTVIGLAMTALLLIFIEPFARLLGASGTLIEPTVAYARYIVIGIPIMLLNVLFGFFVRLDGNPNLAMAGILTSIVLNIVLDVVFIVPCRMGVGGAALALIVSQVVSIAIMCMHFLKKNNTLRYEGWVSLKLLKGVFKGGLGTASTFIYRAIALSLLNNIIFSLAGQTGMEVYVVVFNVSLIAMTLFEGVSQTVQPFISAYYGEKNPFCQRIALKTGTLSALILDAVAIILLEGFAGSLAGVFGITSNEAVLYACGAVRIYAPAILLTTINVMMGYYYQAIGHEKITMLIVFLRELVLLIASIMVCALLFGLQGMWFGYLLCEAITMLVYMLIALKRGRGKGGLLFLQPCPTPYMLIEDGSLDGLTEKTDAAQIPSEVKNKLKELFSQNREPLEQNSRTQVFVRPEDQGYTAYVSGDKNALNQGTNVPETSTKSCDLVGIKRSVTTMAHMDGETYGNS